MTLHPEYEELAGGKEGVKNDFAIVTLDRDVTAPQVRQLLVLNTCRSVLGVRGTQAPRPLSSALGRLCVARYEASSRTS